VVYQEKMLFGMFWAFSVVLTEKNVVWQFQKPDCFEVKLLDCFQPA